MAIFSNESGILPDADHLFCLSALCAPDIPLPEAVFQTVFGLAADDYGALKQTLLAQARWVQLPMGVILTPNAAREAGALRVSETARFELLRALAVAAEELADRAMAQHSKLAQAQLMKPIGPHIWTIAQAAEAHNLPQAPLLWGLLGEYLIAVAEYAGAAECLNRSLAGLRAQTAPDLLRLETEERYGDACLALERWDAAECAYQHVLQLAEQLAERSEFELAPYVENLGKLAFRRGDLDKAIDDYQQTLELERARRGPDHNRVGARWNNLGRVYQAAGRLEEAVNCFEQAARVWQTGSASEHHANLALAFKNLGAAHQQMGHLEQARDFLLRGIAISEGQYGKDHPDIGRDANLLGSILQEMGELESARDQFRRALRIDTAAFGQRHPEVALTLNNLGGVLYQLGEIEDARTCFTRALQILETCVDAGHPYWTQAKENLDQLPPKPEAD
ncbi:MAG: tetratricopeptide repeat protein [Anaerolineaceae bacterium]|nr:tetratricopeptide repeat protein [Anaerolineaceae bacterium]